MKKVGLIGIALVTLLLVSAIPVSAVPLENVSMVFYNQEGKRLTCPQNDTDVDIMLKFDITSTFPKTYQICIVPQAIGQSNFDFTSTSIDYIKRNSVDQTNNATLADGTLPPSVLCVYVNEGSGTLSGKQNFDIRLKNVHTPPVPGNYTIAIGIYESSRMVQYGEYAEEYRICPQPVVPVVPEPGVEPCGCTYKYDEDSGTLMQAVPEACFRLVAPYEDGFEFVAFKKFVDGVPKEVLDDTMVRPVYSDECLRYETNYRDVSIDYDFNLGTQGWSNEDEWNWGEPYDMAEVCTLGNWYAQNVWGLNIYGNYSSGNVVSNLTSPDIEFACPYNDTVYVTFSYNGFLEPGDVVEVEGWDGTQWVKIAEINSSTANICDPNPVSAQFEMNKSDAWTWTKIRFRFVEDGDGNTSVGIYIYNVSIYVPTMCEYTYCAEKKPLYYYTDCQCLEVLSLNDLHTVYTEAVYKDTSTGNYVNKTSDALTIIIDNTAPTISSAGSDGEYYYFSLTDNLAGVEANADDEPIKVVAGDDRYFFEHWEKDFPGSGGGQIYTYHVYDPADETRSAAIHFDKIELGLDEYLGVVAGCEDCYIYETGFGEGCYEQWYEGWPAGYLASKCVHSAWVRVPLNICEMSCSAASICENCYPQIGCENCALIEYADYGGSVEFGISIDMIVYGTGIKVFLNGEDISDQVTIESDGQNATVKVPKSLVTETSELMIVATDNVGNANYATFELAPSGGTTGPVGEVWQQYDGSDGSVPDGKIETTELLKAISDWLDDKLTTEDLLEVINKWLES